MYIFYIIDYKSIMACCFLPWFGFIGGAIVSLIGIGDKKKTIAICIETGIQNSGLGLVLLFNPKIFPPDLAIGGMLFITAWWGIWHIISGLSVSFVFARWHKD